MFHTRNTMPLEDLQKGKLKERSQRELIFDLFKSNWSRSFTPFEVLAELNVNWPITSVRRAMTDLTNEGKLTKDVANQRKGEYGTHNCTWWLARTDLDQPKLF